MGSTGTCPRFSAAPTPRSSPSATWTPTTSPMARRWSMATTASSSAPATSPSMPTATSASSSCARTSTSSPTTRPTTGTSSPPSWRAKCGKDVISEKPLTLFLAEGKALCKAIAENKRIFQTASENRSIDVYIRLIELVRAGRSVSSRTSRWACRRATTTCGSVPRRRTPSSSASRRRPPRTSITRCGRDRRLRCRTSPRGCTGRSAGTWPTRAASSATGAPT